MPSELQHSKPIFYGFAGSSNWEKLRSILVLRKIPYSFIEVPMATSSRPALRALGITYRRVPVMVIGKQVIFDSHLIVLELERRFTAEMGHPSLMSPPSQITLKFSQLYYKVIFDIILNLIDPQVLPSEMKQDIEGLFPWVDLDTLPSKRPETLSALRTELVRINNMLSESPSEFLLPSSSHLPTILDLTIYPLLSWAIQPASSIFIFPSSEAPLEYRKTIGWMERMKELIDNGENMGEVITAEEGVKRTLAAASESGLDVAGSIESVPYFNKNEAADPLIELGQLKIGDEVEVTPTDVGPVPQRGELLNLGSEVVAIAIEVPESGKKLVGLFPRSGYSVRKIVSG